MVSISEFNVETIGTGRQDYSSEITIISAPMARRHQIRSSLHLEVEYTLEVDEDITAFAYLGEILNELMSLSDLGVYLSKNYLVRGYIGIVDISKFITTPMTENDLIECTVWGPFGEHFDYGKFEVKPLIPLSYLVTNPYHYLYIFFHIYHDEREVICFRFQGSYMEDKYAK